MKKICLILLAVILTFTVMSCKKEETNAPEGMFLVENDAVYYDLYLPEGWIIDRNDGGMVSAHVSAEDTSNISVTAFEVPREYEDLDTYLEEKYKTYFTDNFTDMEIVEDFAETTVDRRDARRIIFKATVGGLQYQFEQVITVGKNGYIHVFTYTSTPDMFANHSEDVDTIIKEFKFN